MSVEKAFFPLPVRIEMCVLKLRADFKSHSPWEFGPEPDYLSWFPFLCDSLWLLMSLAWGKEPKTKIATLLTKIEGDKNVNIVRMDTERG